jgi:hypothetical protein
MPVAWTQGIASHPNKTYENDKSNLKNLQETLPDFVYRSEDWRFLKQQEQCGDLLLLQN